MKYIIALFLLKALFLKAQDNVSLITCGCIKEKVSQFMIDTKMIGEDENFDNRVFILEILNRTIFNEIKSSIYVILVLDSHSPTFFLINEGNSFKILNGYNTKETYEELFLYIKKHFNDEQKIIEYMEKITEVLKRNLSTHYRTKVFPLSNWIDCDC